MGCGAGPDAHEWHTSRVLLSISIRPRKRIGFQSRNTSLNADHLRGGSSSASSSLVLLMLSSMLPVPRSQREPLRPKNVEHASVFVRLREAPSSSSLITSKGGPGRYMSMRERTRTASEQHATTPLTCQRVVGYKVGVK